LSVQLRLIRPTLRELPGYMAALERGWHADDEPSLQSAIEEYDAILRDPEGFLAAHDNEVGGGRPITLPDGTLVPRLPSIRRWIWDGEFCGVVGFRWKPGSDSLPTHVLGHIGYAVVPWKRACGYASEATRQMLFEARLRRLGLVEVSASPHNVASRRVVERNGGELLEVFVTPDALGAEPALRYGIPLTPPMQPVRVPLVQAPSSY
jgi:predicted acetyltransferase